ncbi:MAG TPA: hypothetical protein PKX79_07485 [Spirochaetota bacterium]|nr:hypothetical protein [Spirochaetota bacterium]HOK91791.1 hypothetical protein [Spirochaetota bacterium]HPP95206.1 hypothetical protein [Spirochaetota bacterium]
MKHLTFIIISLALSLSLHAEGKSKNIYYFYAENCSACKEAQSFYQKPSNLKDGGSWNFNGWTFIAYRIADEKNQIVRVNINKLNKMCTEIKTRTKTNNFVYFRRDVYEFYINKGLPYFKKEDKYSRKDDPFPTPIFVIGDRVVLGFNPELIQSSMMLVK